MLEQLHPPLLSVHLLDPVVLRELLEHDLPEFLLHLSFLVKCLFSQSFGFDLRSLHLLLLLMPLVDLLAIGFPCERFPLLAVQLLLELLHLEDVLLALLLLLQELLEDLIPKKQLVRVSAWDIWEG